jgi:hypothetical protein
MATGVAACLTDLDQAPVMLRALFLRGIFKGSVQGTMQVSANITAVQRGAHGILARACARAAAEGQDT